MKGTSKRRKRFQVFEIGILHITLLAVMFSIIDSNDFLVIAQPSDNEMDNTNSSLISQADRVIGSKSVLDSNNFNMEGIITSVTDDFLVQKGGIVSNQSTLSFTNSDISSQENILSGKWRIDVVNGNVEYFKSNMTATRSDRTDMHDHQIEFRSDDPEILLLPNNTAVVSPNPATVEIAALNSSGGDKNITSVSRTDDIIIFSGVADVITNGVIEWRGVPTSVSIFNGSAINMKLDPKIVNNHFSDIPLYGLVKSIKPIKVIQNETGL
jgi:hypothetical protein